MFRTLTAAIFLSLLPAFARADSSLTSPSESYDAGFNDGREDAEFDQWLKEDAERSQREDKALFGHSYTDFDTDQDSGATNFHHRPSPPPPANSDPTAPYYSEPRNGRWPRPVDIDPSFSDSRQSS